MTNRRNCDDIYKLTCIKSFFFNTEMFNMQNIFQNELRSESLKKIGFFLFGHFFYNPNNHTFGKKWKSIHFDFNR